MLKMQVEINDYFERIFVNESRILCKLMTTKRAYIALSNWSLIERYNWGNLYYWVSCESNMWKIIKGYLILSNAIDSITKVKRSK
jgi:hypothetical protein